MFPFGRQHGPLQWGLTSCYNDQTVCLKASFKKNVFVRCECKIPRISKGWTQLCGNFLLGSIFQAPSLSMPQKSLFFVACTCAMYFFFWTKKKLTKKTRKIPQTIRKLHLPSSYLSFFWSTLEASRACANIRPVFPLCQGTSTWLITSRRPIILEISNLRYNSAPKRHELHDLHISKVYYSIPWGVRRPFI